MNLNDDPQRAFGSEFEFQGDFCTRASFKDMPNPVITIEGLAYSRAYGVWQQRVWRWDGCCEVDSGKVSFQNPCWNEFVDGLVTKIVWSALGLALWKMKPKGELVKVALHEYLLYKRSFATMVFILPSVFEGGQVHVKYQGKSEKLDVSKDAVLNTSVMAWYNEVAHEPKPLTAGYRLALHHPHLAQTPRALSPQNSSRREPFSPLSRHYGDKPEVRKLHGADYHKVVHLLPLAKEFGFTVSFLTLAYDEKAASVEVEVPPMDEIAGSSMSLSDVEEIVESAVGPGVDVDEGSEGEEDEESREDVKGNGESEENLVREKIDFGKVIARTERQRGRELQKRSARLSVGEKIEDSFEDLLVRRMICATFAMEGKFVRLDRTSCMSMAVQWHR
ncbi:hypothetical protein FA13DRAFT_1791723 [Coprinellus micaceus]|uniref:Uncharacterized protein n=1 Tax=Coprinellus micaceus TaxID=71717 RepID=A0A4Y7TAM9_COPMI|nr:hypothetical protein FA13DRAFT_1791723 [Coprinellus micaceus]